MANVGSGGEAQEVAGTPGRNHLLPTRKWGSYWPPPALCSHLRPGMLPQSSPMSGLAPFFQEASLDHVLPLLLGNSHSPCAPSMESSFCYLVSGLGARDPSPQIDSILSRAQPSSHIPQRPGAQVPHTSSGHIIFTDAPVGGSLFAAPGLSC